VFAEAGCASPWMTPSKAPERMAKWRSFITGTQRARVCVVQ
jgi:hypothetical protein